jgi:hypothetical protein
MKKTARLFFGAAVLALAVAPGVAGAMSHVTTPHPIQVNGCNPQRNAYMSGGYSPAYYPGGPYWGWPSVYGYNYYQYPVNGNPTLSIDYKNATNVVMSHIEFGLVANGRLVAEVQDVGTFSPGAEIKHQFGLSRNVFPLQTGLAKCIPLKITFADGTKWKSPHLPALQRGIYAHP